MTTRRWQLACIAALVGVFVLSFILPAWGWSSDGKYGLGWQAFWYFAEGISKEVSRPDTILELVIGWSPNLLFPAGTFLLLVRRNKSAMMLGILASLAACYWLKYMYFLGVELYSGYFVWLASMVLLALAGGCFAVMASRKAGADTSAQPSSLTLPDPGALALLDQPQTKPAQPTDMRSDPPEGSGPSSIQPPCSPSS